MTRSSATYQSITTFPTWQMPIFPERYPDRGPKLSDEEKAFMEEYVTAPVTVVCRNSIRILNHNHSCISTVKKQKRRISGPI
jgi:hypothetical protein